MSITSRTTADTVATFAALAGQRVTITAIVRWSPDGTSATAGPRCSAPRGG